MHKTYYINGSSKEKYFFKCYANILTKMKNLAKKLYFHHKLEEFKNNPKVKWNLLCALLPSNTSSSTPSSLTVNNETFTKPTAIANQLNHHFVNIGKSLVTNLSGQMIMTTLHILNRLVLLLYIFIRQLHLRI